MAESPAESPRRVLIADGDPGSLSVLSAWLEKEGYRVDLATNGEEALRRAQEDPPDLIFLDITVPKVDGYALLMRLKGSERTHGIPVLITAGSSEKEDKDLCVAFGAVALIEKPYRIADVASRLADALT